MKSHENEDFKDKVGTFIPYLVYQGSYTRDRGAEIISFGITRSTCTPSASCSNDIKCIHLSRKRAIGAVTYAISEDICELV